MLTIQSVTGHTTPANTSFPAARYTDCNDVTHDVTSVNDLTDKQVKHFEIYSDTALTITLTVSVTQTICFDMSDLTDLTVQEGNTDSGFGTAAPSIIGVAGDVTQYPVNAGNLTNTRTIQIMYEFDQDVTIHKVAIDLYSSLSGWYTNPNGAIGFAAKYLDAGDNEIDAFGYSGVQPYNQWHTRELDHVVVGVRKVWVYSAITTSDPASGNIWHDNLCIAYKN